MLSSDGLQVAQDALAPPPAQEQPEGVAGPMMELDGTAGAAQPGVAVEDEDELMLELGKGRSPLNMFVRPAGCKFITLVWCESLTRHRRANEWEAGPDERIGPGASVGQWHTWPCNTSPSDPLLRLCCQLLSQRV